jgi:hypothetical protein
VSGTYVRRVEIVIMENSAANGLTNPVSLSIRVDNADGTTQQHASVHASMRLALMQAGQQAFNLHTVGELGLKAGEVRGGR